MKIYKVFRQSEWEQLQADGQTDGAPADVADGYIHFSTAQQLSGTLEKHFAGETDLVLAQCDTETMHLNLRWETARDGSEFPHLYRPLLIGEVVEIADLETDGKTFKLPDWVT